MSEEPLKNERVPESAVWDEKDLEWVVGEYREGRKEGAFSYYREDGSICCQVGYEDGKAHGSFRRFHENGEASQEGTYVLGEFDGPRTWSRSTGETTELTFPEAVSETVWSANRLYDKGIYSATLYYRKNGEEVFMDGTPIAASPAGVPDQALYYPAESVWCLGRVRQRGNDEKRIGSWRWWNKEGILTQEEEHQENGGLLKALKYDSDGQKESYEEHNGRGVNIYEEGYYDGVLVRVRRCTDEGNETYEARWNSKGQLRKQRDTEWAKGEIVYRKELGEEGVLLLEATGEEENQSIFLFREEGGKLAEGILCHGVLTGSWKVYGEDGNVRHEFDPGSLELEVKLEFARLWYGVKKAAFFVYARALPPLSESEELSKVDWSDVEGPYGDVDAKVFPYYIRVLTAKEPVIRSYGLGQIYGDTLHQGSVYISTVKVIPLLVGVLQHPMADKLAILDYLFYVGSSAAQYEEEALAALEDSDGEEESDWVEPILGVLRCLSEGMPEIQKLVELEEPEIKEKVILLSQFSSEQSIMAETLATIAKDSRTSLSLRAIAVNSLSKLKALQFDNLEPFLNASELLLQAVSAIACGLRFGTQSSPDVIEAIHRVMNSWSSLEPSYNELSFVDGHLRANLALAAGAIRTPRARELTGVFCEQLDELPGDSALVLGQGLLGLALGTGERPFADDFIDVLRSLAGSKKFFTFNVNAAEILGMWNLPRESGELMDFVSELDACDEPEAFLYSKIRGKA